MPLPLLHVSARPSTSLVWIVCPVRTVSFRELSTSMPEANWLLGQFDLDPNKLLLAPNADLGKNTTSWSPVLLLRDVPHLL